MVRILNRSERLFASLIVVVAACATGAGAAPLTFTREVLAPEIGPSGAFEVKLLNIDGKPTVFYDTFGGVSSKQKTGSTWTTETVVPSSFQRFVLYMDATRDAAGQQYLGIGYSTNAAGQANGVELFAKVNGVWTSQYQKTGGTGLGGVIDLGLLDGKVVAAYTGADNSYYSRSGLFLQQVGNTWQETSMSVPNNAGITHLNVGQFGAAPLVIADTTGGFGAFVLQRGATGAWSNVNLHGLTGGNGVAVGDSFFDKGTIYTRTASGFQTQPVGTPPPTSYVGADFQLIRGIPTVVYFDRTDNALHYRTQENGAWTDQIIDQGSADWEDSVSLVDLGDRVGVAYYGDHPSGRHPLVYLEAPLPAVLPNVPLPPALCAGAVTAVFAGWWARGYRRNLLADAMQ